MRHHIGIATVVAAAGLTCPALAQDSVSTFLGGLPGDALNPWSEGCAAYVVDLSPFVTSMGNTFGIAPIIKASKSNSGFFNSQAPASSISPDIRTNTTFTRTSYSFWQQAGAGVGQFNSAPQSLSPSGQASRFAVAMTEFGTTDIGAGYNGVIGAVVSYDPNNPNRLYVDRRMAAVNLASEFQDIRSSSLGGVSVDADGNVYYRADGFQAGNGPDPLTGNNIFRTRLLDRDCGTVNFISNSGSGFNAADRLVNNSTTTQTVPSHIPASVAGGNGVHANPDFNGQYVYGSMPGMSLSTPNHLDFSPDHRGSLGQTSHLALGDGAYSFAISSQNPVNTGLSNVINVFSVDATGAVVSSKGFIPPLTITDNDSGFTVNYFDDIYQGRHHLGASAFNGGVGTVAIGRDQAGRTLIAKTIQELGTSSWISSQIVVGRYSDPNGPVEWTTAGYIDIFNLFSQNEGKAIYDADGNVIGNLAHMGQVPTAPQGPSMSAPAIDSVGNIWFTSLAEIYGIGPGGSSAFRTALIRAVYNPDDFSYRLELVLNVFDVFEGLNSDRNYNISFLPTTNAAGNGPANNSFWSSYVSDSAWNNISTDGLDTMDTRTNGGVVLTATIIYDIDGDDFFNNPTAGNFDPSRPADEAYIVTLYIGHYDEQDDCIADFNNDGQVNFFDVSAFITAFNNQDPAADINGDGLWNFFDVSAYITLFNAGCP
ncbi:MAG: hypothetical protein LAT64_05650 [Phycisphaerales bacterium]|nr:hypothetical protein [Planctomycetota bacterium]MCH8508241.1 hypothetical protein [Phycisphaerales bacterium]